MSRDSDSIRFHERFGVRPETVVVGLGLLPPRPFPPGAVVVVELNPAGLHYGLVAVARVAHAVARPDGYLVGRALLTPLPGELLWHLSDVVPA
jgi:hypothetical protein